MMESFMSLIDVHASRLQFSVETCKNEPCKSRGPSCCASNPAASDLGACNFKRSRVEQSTLREAQDPQVERKPRNNTAGAESAADSSLRR